jgi:2-polyprenyl-6-methoxyphenol hydroxylase-like FAD-dependent oxidoreductase
MTWTHLHRGLTHRALRDPLITVHHRATVTIVGQNNDHVWVTLHDGTTLTASALIGADGYRSLVRRTVAPHHPDASFAGYTLWLGIADEAALPASLTWPRSLDIRSAGPHYLLGYPLRSADGTLRPGSRRLGWAWYDATRNDVFRRAGSVTDGIPQRSMRPTDISDKVYASLAADARHSWPAPWQLAILDSIQRRDVIGTPISEYVPDRLVRGRLALVGDAAHVPTPMTGSGFATSVDDAAAIAAALAASDDTTIPDAFTRYEQQRLGPAQQLVRSGQQFSRSFAE